VASDRKRICGCVVGFGIIRPAYFFVVVKKLKFPYVKKGNGLFLFCLFLAFPQLGV